MAARAALLLLLPLLAPAAEAGLAPERALVSLGGPDAAWLRAQIEHAGGRVLEDFAFIHVSLVEAPAPALQALRAMPRVAGVYPEEAVQLLLSSSRPAVRVGPALWDAGLQGQGVGVAVVDSGIDGEHAALQGRVRSAVRVDAAGVRPGTGDRDGHGTHIAGIVAGDGSGSPARGQAGMAPRASLVAVDISGAFTTTNAVRAFQWLHDHARELELRVVSNSWGREREDAAYDPDDPVIRASDALVRSGVVVVFSAGNRGPGPGTLTVEAQNPRVLTVGATNDQGRAEAYSSRGPARLPGGGEASWTKPDVVAPGTLITSARANAREGGLYTTLNGTSMAAPHVAGVAALMLGANPRLAPAEVKELLQRTARDRGDAGLDTAYGAGFLDGQRAVQAAREAAGPQAPAREPFRDAGEVRPATTLLPFQAAGWGEVRQPLMVPRDAVGLEFVLRWDNPQSSFSVHLEKGALRLGPLGSAARQGPWMELRGSVEQPLEPGTWHFVARPSGAALSARYELDGAVLVRSDAPASDAPGPLEPFPELLAEQGSPQAPAQAPLLLLGALAAAALAALLASRRRRAAPRDASPRAPAQPAARAPPRAPPCPAPRGGPDSGAW